MIFKDFQPWQIELFTDLVVAHCISRVLGEESRVYMTSGDQII